MIEAGSITTDKISSTFGQELDISSNKSVNILVSKAVEQAIDEAEELIGYRLEIISTSDILSSDITTTTLTARVWHGNQNVTDDFPASRFNWKRVSSDSMGDTVWNNSHRGMKSITLTTLDVYYSATYQCEFDDQEA